MIVGGIGCILLARFGLHVGVPAFLCALFITAFFKQSRASSSSSSSSGGGGGFHHRIHRHWIAIPLTAARVLIVEKVEGLGGIIGAV